MKTRIGLSATAVACIAFLLAFYGGYVALILLTGYALLCEANDWLRSTVVKALVLSLAFSVCYTLLGLIPNLLDTINSIIRTFGGESFSYSHFSAFISFLRGIVDICEKVVFLLLALFALKMKTIKIGFIDKFVDEHLSFEK